MTGNSEAFSLTVTAEVLLGNFVAAGLQAFLGDGRLWI